MSKMTLAQLLSEMQDKSMTYGWDAITLYDQRKANELLFQLYVERFNSENGYIEPLSMVAPWGDGSYKEHIYGLKLSSPRLSFESADPSLPAKARLTMDMIGGMIVSTKKSPGGPLFVSRMLKILPVGGPQLWMDQPVTKAEVTELGDVLIDLANADNFMANFVVGDLAAEDVGRRFKEYFEKEIPPEQKKFPLGTLEGDLNGVLTPKNFEVKTMKSDPSAVFGDEEYGDGAVILFITLKDGRDGTAYPNANSIYMLPSDDESKRYTGAMFLSSRVLFDKIMRGPAEAEIGHGIRFKDYTPENGGGMDVAWPLRAEAGGLDLEYVYRYKVRNDDFDAVFKTNVYSHFKEDEGGSALTVKPSRHRIEYIWDKSYSTAFSRVIYWDWPTGEEWDYGTVHFVCNYRVRFDVVLDKESGVVDFVPVEGPPDFEMSVTGFDDLPWHDLASPVIKQQIEDWFRPQVFETLKSLTTPTLDTFLLRNLLFPGHNALHLTEAFVPGDLAVFGEIDPLRTSTVLSPGNSTVEASSSFQFTLFPEPTNVTWTAKDVDGNMSLPDVISPDGYFTAPAADQLPDGFLAIVVQAQGTLNGRPVQSSALVSVVSSLIVVNPLYDSADRGDRKELSAHSVDGASLEWRILTTEWGSRLEEVEGEPEKRLYIAGGSTDPAIPLSMDKIEVKQTSSNGQQTIAYIHIVIVNQMIATPMWISDDSDPASGTVQFELRGNNGPVDPSRVIWKLLGGAGTFDEQTGIYREPDVVPPGSLVVVSGTVPGDFQNVHAFAAVPLPLNRYVELIETLGVTIKAG